MGLRLSYEAVRVAVAHRLGCNPVNRTPVHVRKQWTPVDFMVYVAEGVALCTSVIIR